MERSDAAGDVSVVDAVVPETGDMRAFTLAYLAAHEGACPSCGYNVHGLTEARCPECGRGLEVRVVGTLVPSGWWVLMLVMSGLGAGIGAFVWAVVLKDGLPHERLILTIALVFFMGMVPVPGVVILGRRWFWRRGNEAQSMMSVAVAGVIGIMVMWFMLAIEG